MLSNVEMLAKYPKIAAICTTDGEEFDNDVWWHEHPRSAEVEAGLAALSPESFARVREMLHEEMDPETFGIHGFDPALTDAVCKRMGGA